MIMLGASGCGKTTLLRIIAGLETQSEGEVWIGDRRVDHLPPKDRGIAMVFQTPRLLPWRTLTQNIALIPGAGGAARARELLASLD